MRAWLIVGISMMALSTVVAVFILIGRPNKWSVPRPSLKLSVEPHRFPSPEYTEEITAATEVHDFVVHRSVDVWDPVIIWCQPFFMPHPSFVKSNIAALRSLVAYGRTHTSCTVKVYAVGYAYDESMLQQYRSCWNECREESKDLKVSFEAFHVLDHNYGQAYSWNHVLQNYAKEKSYDGVVVTGCDGIILPSHHDILQEACVALRDHPRMGVISFQMPRPYHLTRPTWRRETYIYQNAPYCELRYLYAPQGAGVANGISVYSPTCMARLNHHIVASGVYCPDDAYTHAILARMGFDIAVCENRLTGLEQHPVAFNNDFNVWKSKSLSDASKHVATDANPEQLLASALESENIFHDWNNPHDSKC